MTALRLTILMLSLPLALAAAPAPAAAPVLKSGVFEPARAAPELPLTASNGKPFRLAGQRGKLVILEFGYTHCPAVCPTTLAVLAQAKAQLGADAQRVQVVFVTVDPERDDAARLASWLTHFGPGFVGLTGTPAQVDAAMKDYGITATRLPIAGGADYAINHSSYLYFIDPKGSLRALLPYGRPAADIVHDARALLREAARD